MELITDLEALADGQLLDHAGDVSTLRQRVEVQEIRVAVSHAIRHNMDTLDPEISALPGRERARRFGGVGTDEVAEFCCGELGARMGITSYAAAALIADGLDLLIRLPRLWARVQTLEVKASYARYVAKKTRDLDVEQAAFVDARVVESADGRIPWSRFEELVAAAIVAADPETAAAKEEAAAREAYARATRRDAHGMRGMFIRAQFFVITKLDATLQLVADALLLQGVGDSNDERRVLALLVLCDPAQAHALLRAYANAAKRPEDAPVGESVVHDRPEDTVCALDWARLLPSVMVTVHCYRNQAEGEGVARVEGQGPVSSDWVRRFLGDKAAFKVLPVLDIEGQAPVDAYEIPDRHRRAVHLMTPADVFAWGSCKTRSQQIDHTEAYQPGAPPGAGQSRIGNYGPMTATHHRMKTHGGWDVKQPFPGIYLWRDKYGATYLVDHTGTRRVAKPSGAAARPTANPASRLEIQFAELLLSA